MNPGIHPSMECESSDGTVADIGALLRASRIRRGEGLRDVADQLRIRFVHLEAIEDGRFKELPGATYAIGFIRTYAEHLGLDGEEIVRRFKSRERGPSDEAELVFPSIIPEHGAPGGAIVMVGLLMAMVGYGSWYFLSSRDVVVSDTVQPLPASIIQKPNSGTIKSIQTGQNALVEASSASAAPAPLKQPGSRRERDLGAPASEVPPVMLNVQNIDRSLPSIETGADANRSSSEAGAETANRVALIPPEAPSAAIVEKTGAPQAENLAEGANVTPVNQRPGPEGETISPDQPVAQEASASETKSRIKLTATEASWIQVRDLNTNELILSKVLLSGHSYEVPGRTDLGLMTGNAGALDVSVDGDDVPSLGKLGQTRQKIILNADRLKNGTAVEQ